MANAELTGVITRTEDQGMSPLPYYAQLSVRRLEMALAGRAVVNFDRYGSIWGASPVEEIERDIAEARADGVTVDEWQAVDRTANPMRVIRIDNQGVHGGIHAFTTWTGLAESVSR